MHYDNNLKEYVKVPDVDAFIEALVVVCQRYGMSLEHEDQHGAFIVTHYRDDNIQWLREAFIDFN